MLPFRSKDLFMTKGIEIERFGESFYWEKLDESILRAREALLDFQHPEGYWCFELEADSTIPAEYIMMMHFMDEVDESLQSKMTVYLRAHQADHGGWPLFYGGKFDLSCSVKAYFALRLAGDHTDEGHMVRAREAILSHGGAARCNVFTRIVLALFEQIPWRGVPFIPVEIMLLPRWFPFHISKVSYWSRTVAVPLSVLVSLKPKARNPKGVHIQELFVFPPKKEKRYFPIRSGLNHLFLLFDKAGHLIEPFIPRQVRRQAVEKAERWFTERLNGTDGLGAIFPAMVNAHEALACLGYPPDHPHRMATKEALRKLVITRNGSAYCQPCVSPIWDTALCCLALQEEGSDAAADHTMRALNWLKCKQLVHDPGDWRENHPGLGGGGWPFQFNNPHYPDLDDTAVVAWAMQQGQDPRYRETVQRAADWICGMQSKNGGFSSFDSNNTHYYLNEIPFADHGALLDPPTSDVSARCAALLAKVNQHHGELKACLDYLREEQQKDGSWFGRWGTNYIYGTWSVLAALELAGDRSDQPHIQRAILWLKRVQRTDGGWGEDCDSYFTAERAGQGHASTSFQTAWALLGLMAAGEVDSPEVQRGAEYLLRAQRADGLWNDEWFTAPGFPRVFYLKYHGYTKYFPLWALARYRNLRSKKTY
jgi:squalene-hopene/tetraprenyl-beta-curcumene cyclase